MFLALPTPRWYRLRLRRARRGPVATVVLGLVSGLGASACQKQNIRINGTSLPVLLAHDHGLGIPIDLPGALEAARNYFQTRGVITLAINSDKISPNSSFELINNTTGLSLLKTGAGGFGLTRDESLEGANLALKDNGYELQLTIYPLDPNFVGKFAYGANQLTLNVDAATNAKDAKQQINMEDFTYFNTAVLAFNSNNQEQDGFQGEVAKLSGAYVSNGDYELSSGFVGVINR